MRTHSSPHATFDIKHMHTTIVYEFRVDGYGQYGVLGTVTVTVDALSYSSTLKTAIPQAMI